MLRYELEKRILDGDLAVRDLPAAWNEGLERRLGLKPANDAEGCLQDVHWAIGSFGYYPSYALGALIAAQLYESLRMEIAHFDAEIAAGRFGPLFDWLGRNVHSRRASVGALELIQQATGRPLSSVGVNRHCRTASTAASSSIGADRRMRTSRTSPSSPIVVSRITNPAMPAARASAGYTGGTWTIFSGGRICPPTRTGPVATEAGGGAGSSPNNVIVSPRRPATTPSGIVSATLGTAGRPVSGCTPSGASIGIAAVGTGLTTRGRGADGGGAGAGKTSTNTDACRSSGNSSVARTGYNRIVQATVTCATIENTNV
jgi:hypothetical protein